tara:strand:+ start:406 stop:1035 length:630 start_codon:yes stop_codon:yes gene_type:complete
MCYSAKASIGAYIFSLILSYSLYIRNKKNDRSIAILIFGISTMQIAEFFMHLDPNCETNINKYSSILGMMIILLIQPLFSVLSNIHTQKKITKEIITHIILWFIYLIYMIKYFWPKSSEWCSKKECMGDCKLTWNWWKLNNDYIIQILYTSIILIIPIYIMNKHNLKNMMIWFLYIFLSVAFIYNNKYFGTLWCFWGPLGAYLLQYFIM